MNPITKITLENFQSHSKTTIEIAPNGQLTTIVGPSDTGKTVILRALRWVFYNQPSGAEFIRAGATFARVTVEFASGDIVIRHRSTGSINRYLVNGETYEGFGNNVPLEVQEMTGVRPVTIGDLELTLNLAEQLDGPFLGKSVSAPARAKVLGKLAGTEEIDLAGKRLGTDLYRRNQDEKRLKVSLEELREKVKGYDYLPAMKLRISQLEALMAAVKQAQERRKALAELKAAHDRAEAGIMTACVVIKRWKGLDQAGLIVGGIEKAVEKKQQIETLKEQLVRVNTGIKSVWAVIDRLVGLKDAETAVKDAEAATERRQRVQDLSQKHLNLTLDIERCKLILVRHKGVGAAEEALQVAAGTLERRTALVSLMQRGEQVSGSIYSAQLRIAKCQHIDETEILLDTVKRAVEKVSELRQLSAQHGTLAKQEQEALKRVIFYEERIPQLVARHEEELVATGVCPTCGQKICKENLKEAI